MDYILNDLNLNGKKTSQGDNKIILEYVAESAIQPTSIITFSTDNKIKKYASGDIPRGIALISGTTGNTIKVQLSGIVKLTGYFVPTMDYYLNVDGTLTTTVTSKKIGMAISPDELLLAKGVFIDD